ncbi:MAG: SMP-30/gluconolactonase/LRE family protein [Rhodobacteraceae bacterium]|nr:SMP-30/gluconolactonase/LRE family protein [Paracoccaceae bacterium]
MTSRVFDDRPCSLGESPLWHPLRHQLFWFDITGNRLLTRDATGLQEWHFAENVSAAGAIDRNTLLIASETRLMRFDIETGSHDTLCLLEPDTPHTRSNDGRADPLGGFWIGTMGKKAETGAGAIYRYHRGELRQLFPGISIPNAICFAPDGSCAYFTDTPTGQIMRQPLNAGGWPQAEPQLYLDLTPEGLHPDGAVTDARGNLWNAQWGAARIAGYAPDGSFLGSHAVPATHSTCPAFGGVALSTLFCTSARQGLDTATIAAHPQNGQTFFTETELTGRPEPLVEL